MDGRATLLSWWLRSGFVTLSVLHDHHRSHERAHGWGVCYFPHWHAHQSALEGAPVAAGFPGDAAHACRTRATAGTGDARRTFLVWAHHHSAAVLALIRCAHG